MGFFGDIIKNVFNKNDLNKGVSKSAAQKRNSKENEFKETAETGLKRNDLLRTKNSQFIRQNVSYNNQNDYDITSYIPEDGVLSVVNNNNRGGTWQSKFGYLESHADGLKDGTVIRVYNDGTYSLLDTDNASEDYKAQYDSFKEGYYKAKREYDKAIRFQNLANRGYDVVSYGTENETNHADSFIKMFTNMFKTNMKLEEAEKPEVLSFSEWKKQQGNLLDGLDSKQQKSWYNVYKETNKETLLEKFAPEKILGVGKEAAVAAGASFVNALQDKNFTASVKDYMYTKSWYQAILDHKDSTKAYKELYKKDPDKARDLLMEDTNLSDRERAYIAYTLVQGKEDKKLGDYLLGFGLNTLYDIGETMDWLSNPVKGAVGYLDNKDGQNWTGITNTGKTLEDTIAAAYRTSWDNEGRQSYNYDTGFIPFDFALEILSDPESIVAMASKGLQKGIAGGFESVLPKGTRGISDIIKQSMNADELVTNLKVAFPDSAEALTTMARNMHEYEHAIKLDYALNGALNMKNGADKFLALGATNGVPLALKATMPIVARGGRWVVDKVQGFELMILEHRMAAAADSLGKVGEDLTLDTVTHFIDETNLNLTVMRKVLKQNGVDASALKLLSKDEKLRLVAQAYNNSITDSLATMRQSIKKDRALLKFSEGNVEDADNPIEAMLIEYGSAHEGDLKLQSILDQYQRTNFFDATDEERHQFFMNIMNSDTRRGEEAVVRHLVRKDAVKTMRMLGLEDEDLYQVFSTIVDTGTHYFQPADAPGFTKEAYDFITGLNKDSVVNKIKRGIDTDVLNNSFKKIDSDSIIDKDTSKVYVLKPKEDIVADVIQRNGYYRAAVESFQTLGGNESVYSQVLMSADPVVAKSGVRDVMHDMLASSSAVHNYYFLKDRIKDSACIPENLKDLFVDKLFSESFDSYCKNTFRGTDAKFIDNTRIDNRSRTIANRLIDEVQSLDAARARMDTFEYLGCNSRDNLRQNVENIQKLVDDMPDKDDFTFYVPYSMSFTPDNELYKVCVKDGDDVREFVLLDGNLNRDDDALGDFEQYMLGLRSGTSHAGMRIQLVGFNNHVYGLQTDALANAWFYRNYSQVGNIIRGSLDLADDMRLEKYGIVPIPESAHQELIEMFKTALYEWRGDRELKKIALMDRDIPFSVKPPTYNQLNDWVLRTSDYEEVDLRGGFNGVAKNMHDSLVATAQELQYAEQGLTRNLGYIKTTADTKYFDVVKELPRELGAKKVYDAKIVSDWFPNLNTANIPFSKMREWYDIANSMQKTFNSIKDPGWCQEFAKDINIAFKKIIKDNNYLTPDWFKGTPEDWAEIVYTFGKERNLSRKLAVLKYLYDINPKAKVWDFKLVTALADPSKTFARNGRFYNPYQRISGSVENPFSKWNIETGMNATIKQMDSLLSNIELYDAMRQEHPELLGELAVAQIAHDNKMREFYNEIVGYLKKARDTGGYAGTIKMKNPVSGKEGEYVIAFGDKHIEKYIENLNPYEKYWYEGVHQPSTLEYINKGIQEAEVWVHDGQLRAISSMSNDEFLSHLVHDTQGICPNALASFNAADKKNFLQFFHGIQRDPRFETYVDETREVYTIFVRNIDELRETTPVINFNYNIFKHAQTSGHDMSQNARSMMYLYNKAAEFNDPSYTFLSMQHQDDTYFYTLRDLFLPHETDLKPPKVRSASAYDCGYVGNIKELMGNPEVKSYVSGNMFTNFLNSYARTIVDSRNIETLAPVMFKDNIYKNMHPARFKSQMDALDIFGYRILARDKFGYIKDVTDYTEKEIRAFDKVAILRADEAQKAIIDMRNTITDPRPWMSAIKAIRKFESEYYLKWMLDSTPFPGLNNWKDSTIKAILAEGVGILPYYRYAVDLIRKSRKPLVDLYKMLDEGKIDTLTEDVIRNIAKKKWGYDISVDDLVKVFKFKNSTVSGIDSDQRVLLETLEDAIKPILKDEEGNILRDEAGKALRGHNEWFGFNEWLFSSPEVVNRLAIYLKAMDETGNVAKAYERIKLSQFEYSKSTIQTYLDIAKPFSTFQLYNIKFWLSDLWFQEGGARRAGHIADIYNSSYDTDEAAERYWSDDMMELRALIDTCNFEEKQLNYVQHYDKFKDFIGSPTETAKSNGWIKFSDSDTLWFKAGISWLDAYTGVNSFSFGLGDNLWSPFEICVDVTKSLISGESKLLSDFEGALRTAAGEYKEDDAEYLTGSEFWSRHGYDIVSLLPVVSTAYYFLESFVRNELYAGRADKGLLYRLCAALPGMFAPAKEYPAGSREQRWYEMPVGFDWYNQSDEYKKTHRYIPGVSYVPAWVYKDPATYINTLGRLQQILGGTEGAYEFMQLGEGFWFTKDGDTYKLHNYKLMIGDEQTRAALKDSLINKFGWSADAADYLLDQWGEPTWKKKYSSQQAKESSYYLGGSRSYNNTAILIGKTKNSIPHSVVSRYKANLKPTQAPVPNGVARPKFNNNPLGVRVSTGKNVKYSDSTLHRMSKGVDPEKASRQYQINRRWHYRRRDIYKDNYAKYGASRMAMEQNLKNYSNRSITEMRRTNQTLRYSQIHRHSEW